MDTHGSANSLLALAPERRPTRSTLRAPEDGTDYCRICRGEATPEQPLFYPCKCSGSIRYVHQECLMEWLSHSQKKYCELCKTSFRFTKLYDRHMPESLPAPLFVRQLARHALQALVRWARYLLVACVWLCCLPWCIRQVWRGLFWLADGNWVMEQSTFGANATDAANITTLTTLNSTSLDNGTTQTPMPDFMERVTLVLPFVQFSLADLVRLFTSHGLLGRLLHLLFPALFPFRKVHSTPDMTTQQGQMNYMIRPPSLLSDVQFLSSWSRHPVLNHIVLDISEGQLICMLLIAAFILVFLIREWVINQQPMLNLPDPDVPDVAVQPPPAVEAPPPAEVENEPQRRIAPLRRRQHPRDADAAHANNEDETPAVAGQPIDFPPPRRTLTEDNILNPVTDVFDGIDMPPRPASASSIRETMGPDEISPHPNLSQGESISDHAETPAARHLEDSVLVERHFEIEFSDSAQDQNIPDNLLGGEQPSTSGSTLVRPESESLEAQRLEMLGVTGGLSTPQGSLVDHPSVQNRQNGEENHMKENEVQPSESDEEDWLPTPGSVDIDQDEQQNETNRNREPANISTEEQDSESSEDTPEKAPFWDKLVDWLWHTDVSQQAAAPMLEPDEERIMEDPAIEAPFVPVQAEDQQNPQPPLAAVAPAPAEQGQQGHEPNIVMGVDLNDPNAVEDAEDLDGILELLGMEGPIFGMFQNVIFSLFLISITLSASIWCPYIWGKIALLFLSNPVGMLFKAPLFVLSRTADLIIDTLFFVVGLLGVALSQAGKIVKVSTKPVLPKFSDFLDPTLLEAVTLELSQKSGSRLEKTITGALLNLKPDLPTFSMLSHQALVDVKGSIRTSLIWSASTLVSTWELVSTTPMDTQTIAKLLKAAPTSVAHLPLTATGLSKSVLQTIQSWTADLTFIPPAGSREIDQSLAVWSTEDKLITIVLGYAFFAFVGMIFLELAHMMMGLKPDEKVEGHFADILRQAGGVMKVIVIIGIEMLVFPLYCGILLDFALLPLFANASFTGRIAFMTSFPLTGIFVHWFIGTCYMFHFALFVSICRKIMRKGVLYFIRDPDDPTFHPVRDVLERPVPTQLGKIAFSALVYGGLVIVCLGSVVWTLSCIQGLLPIRWATSEPRFAVPVDVVFYNFLLPVILRWVEPPKKISAMYEWWFRKCARGLRLTHFLFGEEREDEKISLSGSRFFSFLFDGKNSAAGRQNDGIYVRAPASDSVRIPRGQSVFLRVSDQNERIDGQPDREHGIHGRKDDRFAKIYLPPDFRARIVAFIILLWAFAATTGVSFTIGPLLVGRSILHFVFRSKALPNDLYAMTIGLHVCASLAYAVAYAPSASQWMKGRWRYWVGNSKELAAHTITMIKYIGGLLYLGLFTSTILPIALSFVFELYIYVPLLTIFDAKLPPALVHSAATDVPAIFLLQTWVIGFMYLQLFLRLITAYWTESRVAIALRGIVRNGYFHPDVQLASRAFVLPCTLLCFTLLALPLGLAKVWMATLGIGDASQTMFIYRMSYPALLALFICMWATVMGYQTVGEWRLRIRDEVYLRGERLHNYRDPSTKNTRRNIGASAVQVE